LGHGTARAPLASALTLRHRFTMPRQTGRLKKTRSNSKVRNSSHYAESRCETGLRIGSWVLGFGLVLMIVYLGINGMIRAKHQSHPDEVGVRTGAPRAAARAPLDAAAASKQEANIHDRVVKLTAELGTLDGRAKRLVEQNREYYDQREQMVQDALGISSKPRFRSDGRCGPNFPAPGSPKFGECDPNSDQDQKGPCCRSDSGWCGNTRRQTWGHCPLEDGETTMDGGHDGCDPSVCIDYGKVDRQRKQLMAKVITGHINGQAAGVDAQPKPKPKFRQDGRCGPDFPAPGAPSFGECDPRADADQKGPCCRPSSGWCGNSHETWGHCNCDDCIDYMKVYSLE